MASKIINPSLLRKTTIAVCHGADNASWWAKLLYHGIRIEQRNFARDENGKLLKKGRTAIHVMIKAQGVGANAWFSMEEKGGVIRELTPHHEKITYYELRDLDKMIFDVDVMKAFDEAIAQMVGMPYDIPELARIFLDDVGIHLAIDSDKGTVCSTSVARAIECMTDSANRPSIFGRLILNRITPAHFCNLDQSLKCIGDVKYD